MASEERCKTVAGKPLDHLAARVRGAARKPGRPDPMAVDAELRSGSRPVAQRLDDERRSERGHPVARLRARSRETRRNRRSSPRGPSPRRLRQGSRPLQRRVRSARRAPERRAISRHPRRPARSSGPASRDWIEPVFSALFQSLRSNLPLSLPAIQSAWCRMSQRPPVLHHQDPRERRRRAAAALPAGA